MQRLKLINKRLIVSVFLLSLILYFYLSVFSGYEIFVEENSNYIFHQFNVFLNITFIFILLLTTTIEFCKFLKHINSNSNNEKKLMWFVKSENLKSTFRLIILTFPFATLGLVKFFIPPTEDLGIYLAVLALTSLSVILAFLLIVLYFVYKFVLEVKWVNSYEKDLTFVIENIYFSSIFLDILYYDENFNFFELKKAIQTFLTSKNVENDIVFKGDLASFLIETKKATLPPLSQF